MTDGTEQTPPPPPPPYQPPPPPAQSPPAGSTYAPGTAPKKKGLSPLAWVGIGCGALLLLSGLVLVVLLGFGIKKAGDFANDMEKHPDRASMTIAKGIVRVNPDLELVDSDDDEGTLTIRNKKTGEVVTVDVSDVEEGHISFKGDDGEEVTMGMEKGDDGEGAFTVRDKEGNETFRLGAGGEENIPSWVPRYEDVEIQGTMQNRSGGEISGGFSFETDDSVEDVLSWYADELEDEGMSESGRSDNSAGGSRFVNITYAADGRTVNTMVTSDGGDKTNVIVSYTEKDQ